MSSHLQMKRISLKLIISFAQVNLDGDRAVSNHVPATLSTVFSIKFYSFCSSFFISGIVKLWHLSLLSGNLTSGGETLQ